VVHALIDISVEGGGLDSVVEFLGKEVVFRSLSEIQSLSTGLEESYWNADYKTALLTKWAV
jgi:hypothetical protein